jgi:hypothetical protein
MELKLLPKAYAVNSPLISAMNARESNGATGPALKADLVAAREFHKTTLLRALGTGVPCRALRFTCVLQGSCR